MKPDWLHWLPRQRWYAGRDWVLSAVQPRTVLPLRDGLDLTLLDITYTNGSAECYQVVLPPDAEPEAARQLFGMMETGVALPVSAAGRVLDTEQTNTSVVFGEQVILKLFRRVAVGVNPDIELNRILGAAGNPHVARLLGSLEITEAGQPCALGMASEYAADAVDGCEPALSWRKSWASLRPSPSKTSKSFASLHVSLALRAVNDSPSTSTLPLAPSSMLDRWRPGMGGAWPTPSMSQSIVTALSGRPPAAWGSSVSPRLAIGPQIASTRW